MTTGLVLATLETFGSTGSGYLDSMEFATWAVEGTLPVVATAIHDGHNMSLDLEALTAVDHETRLREEDPWTGEIASSVGSHVTVHRSRFQVDLNRPRHKAVYLLPEDAWGLDLWAEPLSAEQIEMCLAEYDAFYEELATVIEDLVQRHRGFVLYDVHSYNHRRAGPDEPPEPEFENPVVNLGSATLPPAWQGVADALVDSIGRSRLQGEFVDVRSNVRFQGGHLASWVNALYGEWGCALAIEFKKVFMNEWTNELSTDSLAELSIALGNSVEEVWGAHLQCR